MSDHAVFSTLTEALRSAIRKMGILSPTEIQALAVPVILKGHHVLLVAPSGTGKTEAALLPVLSSYMQNRQARGISILYVTPLRALNRDMLKRLMRLCADLEISVQVRHGDTPRSDRQRQVKQPPELLITTPETLQAILPSRLRWHLSSVRWVVIDEIHELVDSKRGAQLSIGLERLSDLTGDSFQRIGLSATVGDKETVARFLGGRGREVKILEAKPSKEFRYLIEFPFPAEEDFDLAQTLYTAPEAAARIGRIKELADSHASTLVFVNSRQNAEMLGLRLGMLDKRVAVHHGSLSREERARIENLFKTGGLKAIICTSTLELGIDIGSVDLTLQYLSPRQVTPLIQRVGRSGHRLGATSKGTILCANSDDLLEAIAIVRRAEAKQLESTAMEADALDVLCHQIAGLAMDQANISRRKALKIVRRAAPYAHLSPSTFNRTLEYVADLRLVDLSGQLIKRARRTPLHYYRNVSMIPDERRYTIIDVTSQRRIGTLGEEFIITKARKGLRFICRGRVWEILRLGEDANVYVVPAEDPTAAIPGWDGEIIPVPFDVAQEVGALRSEIEKMMADRDIESAADELAARFPVDRYGAKRVVEELSDFVDRGIEIPSDKLVLVEAFERFIIIHACFGEAVNRTLAFIVDESLMELGLIQNAWADGYRILIELTRDSGDIDVEEVVSRSLRLSKAKAKQLFWRYVETRNPFASFVKHVAERFGAIPRGTFMGSDQRFLDLARRFAGTPIYDEALREAMHAKTDLEETERLHDRIRSGAIRVETVRLDRPTSLAFHILNKFSEVPEMMAPESTRKQNLDRMKAALEAQYADLFCMEGGHWSEKVRVRDLGEQPSCPICGSRLLALLNKCHASARQILEKRLRGGTLSEEERDILARTRRTADLILAYGKTGVMALLTWGIGPQTAAQILARMHDKESDFLADLLQAKLNYIQTRPFWDV